jgi:hypothetical protein
LSKLLKEFKEALEGDAVNGFVNLALLANISQNFTKEDIDSLRKERDDLQFYLDDLTLSDLSEEEIEAIVQLGKIHTHLVCTLFYADNSFELLSSRHIDGIIQLEFCEEDNGRSDSCYGAHFFTALQKNITSDQLRALLSKQHYDAGFFPWLIARSSCASKELLTEISREFTDAHTWRVPGFYTESESLLDDNDVIGSFVLIQLSKNPIVSHEIRTQFGKKLDFLANSWMKTKADLIGLQLSELAD